MFRMRVKEAYDLDEELDKRIEEVVINIKDSHVVSLDEFSNHLDSIDKSFWGNGECRLNVKVTSDNSEAVIDIGENFKFTPILENLFFLEDVFGKNTLEI